MIKFLINHKLITPKILVNQQLITGRGIFRRHHHRLLYTELSSRSLIRVSGEDSLPFLQGLVTNDIKLLQAQPSIFTVFLNQAGRILFDSIIYKSEDNCVLIECDSHVQQTLIRHLKLYRVRRKVQVDDIAEELKPWVVWNPAHPDIPLSHREVYSPSVTCEKELPFTSAVGQKEALDFGKGICGIPDPRLDALGWRILLPVRHDLGQDSKVITVKSTESDYCLLRYALGVGEGFLDFPVGNSFPLESNVDILNGVNFHKGCYIGQELTARTHHTGVVRKRLMPFRIPEDSIIPSEVDRSTLTLLNQVGRPVAKVRNIVNSYGLALARVEEALTSTQIKLGDHLVQLEKPLWWPPEILDHKLLEK